MELVPIGLAIIIIVYFIYKLYDGGLMPTNTPTITVTDDTIERTPNLDLDSRFLRNKPTSYIVFDLETTGLKSRKDQIIEIGAIKYHDFKEVARFHTYVNPTIPIPYEASAINGIYKSTVRKAPRLKNAIPCFLDFIDGYTLFAYNAKFDIDFLYDNSNAVGISIGKRECYDLLKYAKVCLNLKNYKLVTIKEFFKIDVQSHNALDDCHVAATLYSFCINNELNKLEKKELEANIHIKVKDELTSFLDNNNLYKEYFDIVKDILKFDNAVLNGEILVAEEGIYIEYYYRKKMLFYPFLKLKLTGKLIYALFDFPFDKIENVSLKYTASTKTEGLDKTRIFITEPKDLYDFSHYIIQQYNEAKLN